MAYVIRLSIRALCEFLTRTGSIDARFSGLARGLEGARIHRRLQKEAGAGYAAEVSLALEVTAGEFCYRLNGRADGVLQDDEGTLVDEIKTVTEPLDHLREDEYPEHWAQGQCYAHILCRQRGLPACGVRLTYCHVESGEVRRFVRRFTAGQLEEFVTDLLGQYEQWARYEAEHKQRRTETLKALPFPYEEYRGGQRQMAAAAYRACREGERLFCCAPTGIGKTISTLYPAMKAMGEGYGERIFYLTAKTIARTAASSALLHLGQTAPLCFTSLTLTAKDKLCFLVQGIGLEDEGAPAGEPPAAQLGFLPKEEAAPAARQRNCTPEACPFAKGYYHRARGAVYALLQQGGMIDRPALEAAALEYRVCPYELSLDLSLWCDAIICDYNYLFDPQVRLQRFFAEGGGTQPGEHLFLVDEAHNLVQRSREMFSASLQKGAFFAFKKQLPKKYKRLHKALGRLNSGFVALRKRCDEENARVLRLYRLPTELDEGVESFCAAAEAFLEDHRGSEWESELLGLYFETLFYRKIAEDYDGTYVTLVYRYGGEITAKLFCLDPSGRLEEQLDLGRAAVLFSATLQPLPYYRDTLGGTRSAGLLGLGSPFEAEHLGLFVAGGVSTKYADRERSLYEVAALLGLMATARRGNYIAYFPSYSYMRQVQEAFLLACPGIETLTQESGMDEAARERFLEAFSAERQETLLGFCVMGGLFAEGVDLPGERLVGTAVVGVGLPQMGPEPDAIREYYDEQNGCGFEYAYQYPGMNKVLQAAGRVIRTASDRGVVLLIDSRFPTPRYQQLFPDFWSHWQPTDRHRLPQQLAGFWGGDG